MKYIKNNTDNVIVIKCLSEGKEKKLSFSKNAITAVTDELDTLFKDTASYVKLFTNGTLSYSVKETEVSKESFTNYLIRASLTMDTEGTQTYLECVMNRKLAGETVYVLWAKDNDTSINTEEIDVDDNGEISLLIGTVTECLEFQVFNKYGSVDYPVALSNRMKVYK